MAVKCLNLLMFDDKLLIKSKESQDIIAEKKKEGNPSLSHGKIQFEELHISINRVATVREYRENRKMSGKMT